MNEKRIQQIERQIERIKVALSQIGPMRPGSLTRQYKDRKNQTGGYWQISYTRRMKSRTDYVVSFRQACMNWVESSGIVGSRRQSAWRTADENWNDRRFSRWV
jgi:hypothetical protein